MYKECKTQQSIKRQRHIENTLIEMMQMHDFHDIKISELCIEANIPRKAFYRYFDSKEDVLYACVDHAFFELAEQHEFVNNVEFLKNVSSMTIIFDFWYEHKNLIKALEHSGNSSLVLERSLYWDLKQNDKTFHDLDEEFVTRKLFMFTGLYSLIFTWIRTGNKTSYEMAELAVECLTTPLIKKD